MKPSKWLIGSVLLCFPAPALDVHRILDPMVVPALGDASSAVVTVTTPTNIERVSCDLVIAGGGMGGVAAALAGAENGLRVCLTEVAGWLGGQMTSQGVSALDENPWIESTGATRSYQNLRRRIRVRYEQQILPGMDVSKLNPGGCWVSYLCFEPKVGVTALEEMIAPHTKSGAFRMMLRTTPVSAWREGSRLRSLLVYSFANRRFTELTGKVFIDATELGEVLPLAGAGFRIGADARALTGEPDADETANPAALQSFTYPFVLARGTNPDLPFTKPPLYEDALPQYSFDVHYGPANILRYGMFAKWPKTPGAFWTYRRLIAKDRFAPGTYPSDLAMINWPGNDVCDPQYLSSDPIDAARAFQRGKQVALGFAWWLRNEAPRDEGSGKGFDDLVLRSDVLGSADGLSPYPYIRESRRMEALRMVREQDVAAPWNPGARARHFEDTAAIGYYPIDIHGCAATKPLPQSKPYQVPFGALVSRDVSNLLAGAKNLGVTHIVNGAYRLHPVEWAIGEASGTLAAWAVKHEIQPADLVGDAPARLRVQRALLSAGHPLIWFDDVAPLDSAFAAIQYAALTGMMPPSPESLHFRPKETTTGSEATLAIQRMLKLTGASLAIPEDLGASDPLTWSQLASAARGTESREGAVTRADFAEWLWRRMEAAPR